MITNILLFALAMIVVWLVMAVTIYYMGCRQCFREDYDLILPYVTYCKANRDNYEKCCRNILHLYSIPFHDRRLMRELFEDFVIKFDEVIAMDGDFEERFRNVMKNVI